MNHTVEKEQVFNFEEKQINSTVLPVNGTTDSERSRSPSPERYLSNESNYLSRNTDSFSSTVTADTGNSIFNANYLMSDDKQISQILKEANSINNVVHQNNIQENNKVKVSLFHTKEKINTEKLSF